jgi:hypothetical protein
MEKAFVVSEEEALWIAEMAISRARYQAWLSRELRTAPSGAAVNAAYVEPIGARTRRLLGRARELVAVSKALCQARDIKN